MRTEAQYDRDLELNDTFLDGVRAGWYTARLEILDIHKPKQFDSKDGVIDVCQECVANWPCPSARIFQR